MHAELVNVLLYIRCLLKVGFVTGLLFGLAVVVITEIVFADFLKSEKENPSCQSPKF